MHKMQAIGLLWKALISVHSIDVNISIIRKQ